MRLFPHGLNFKVAGLIILLIFFISTAIFLTLNLFNSSEAVESPVSEQKKGSTQTTDSEGIEPIDDNTAMKGSQDEKNALRTSRNPGSPEDKTKNFNILILGIDRRYGEQKHWRTDVIQLLTLSPQRDKAVITHIPRDIWAGSYKINAVYNLQGPDSMKDKIEEITGQRPDRIIRVDFDAFVWAVDAVGGVTIDVPTSFVDSSYPNDRKGINEPVTVSFEKGEQKMDGETALIYVRSRKGTNGEGSDYARGRRQQIVMRAIVRDFFKPDNLFNPKTAETLYTLATKKVYTDLTLTDTKVLFDVLKNYKNITLRTMGLSTENYLVVPSNRSVYGGAWVLTPKDGDFSPIHDAINLMLQ